MNSQVSADCFLVVRFVLTEAAVIVENLTVYGEGVVLQMTELVSRQVALGTPKHAVWFTCKFSTLSTSCLISFYVATN